MPSTSGVNRTAAVPLERGPVAALEAQVGAGEQLLAISRLDAQRTHSGDLGTASRVVIPETAPLLVIIDMHDYLAEVAVDENEVSGDRAHGQKDPESKNSVFLKSGDYEWVGEARGRRLPLLVIHGFPPAPVDLDRVDDSSAQLEYCVRDRRKTEECDASQDDAHAVQHACVSNSS